MYTHKLLWQICWLFMKHDIVYFSSNVNSIFAFCCESQKAELGLNNSTREPHNYGAYSLNNRAPGSMVVKSKYFPSKLFNCSPSRFTLSPKVQFCANKYCQLANVKSAVLSADCGRTLRQYITHICVLLCCTVLCGASRHVSNDWQCCTLHWLKKRRHLHQCCLLL